MTKQHHWRDALTKARINQGLSQAQLATKLGVTAGAIAHWERGRRDPSYADLRNWGVALGMNVDVVVDPMLVAEDSLEYRVAALVPQLDETQRALLESQIALLASLIGSSHVK